MQMVSWPMTSRRINYTGQPVFSKPIADSALQTALFEAGQLRPSTVFLFSRSLSSEGIWIKLQEPQGFSILS